MRILNALLITGLGLLLVACSGTTAPATAGASVGPAASASGAPAASASSGAQPSTGAGGGGTAGAWCANTVEEVSAALNVTVVTATSTDAPGVGGGCFYNDASGTPVFGTSTITSVGAGDQFKTTAAMTGVETIDGIGDSAIMVGPQGPFVILKGDSFISMGAMGIPIVDDAAAYRVALESLARSAAGRLP